MNIIMIKELKKSYEDDNIKALNGLSLKINKGEFVSIIGPSGSGKSTLLNMIGSLDKPDSGYIEVGGYDLINEKKLNKFRAKKIGFIFQLHNLIPTLTASENVELPMYGQNLSQKDMKKKVSDLLTYMDLDNCANGNITKLSGGERQRIAIARSLVNDPEIILADEPTGSLDSENAENVLNLLKKLHEERKVTLIIVTHDNNVAKMADRIIKLKDGKIENTIQNTE